MSRLVSTTTLARTSLASTIQQSHDDGSSECTPALVVDELLVLMHVLAVFRRRKSHRLRLRFWATAEFVKAANVQSQANPMHHEPSGLLRNADSAMNLIGRNSVLAIGDHPNGDHPFV